MRRGFTLALVTFTTLLAGAQVYDPPRRRFLERRVPLCVEALPSLL
jgi:hypothetical protein